THTYSKLHCKSTTYFEIVALLEMECYIRLGSIGPLRHVALSHLLHVIQPRRCCLLIPIPASLTSPPLFVFTRATHHACTLDSHVSPFPPSPRLLGSNPCLKRPCPISISAPYVLDAFDPPSASALTHPSSPLYKYAILPSRSLHLLSHLPHSLCAMGSLDANLPGVTIDGFKPLDLDGLREQLLLSVDFIVDYYKNVETQPVLPQVQPGYLRHIMPAAPPACGATLEDALRDIHRGVLPGMTNWASPNFFAYFPATLGSAALVGDFIASALNPVAFTWLSCPAATELEELVLDWMAQLLRLPPAFRSSSDSGGGGGGVIHGTTSEAILCTLVAARDGAVRRAGGVPISRLVAYGSDQTHSTFAKACRIAGFDQANVRLIPTQLGSGYALVAARLRDAMAADAAAGLVPAYVCATVGTTSSTAVDPLGLIADVAAEFGVWVHVDAAYAGSACICPEFRRFLDGVERADSLSISPHKWLLTGLDCTCLWLRDRPRLAESLGTNPEYLKNGPSESGLVVDCKDLQVGVGRRFRALKLWTVLRTYGVAGLQAHIRSDVEMARAFEGMVRADRRFEVVVPRRFALVCFRIRAWGGGEPAAEADNRRLLALVNGSGRAYVTHTVLGGKYVLRFAVGSTLTEHRHVASAWDLIRAKTDEVLGGRPLE
ncbi:hypothetical protein B296_00053822, partial [Ensete ventricosum]